MGLPNATAAAKIRRPRRATQRHYKGKTYRSHLLRSAKTGRSNTRPSATSPTCPIRSSLSFRRGLKGKPSSHPTTPSERSLPHGHVGPSDVGLARAPSRLRDAVALIVARHRPPLQARHRTQPTNRRLLPRRNAPTRRRRPARALRRHGLAPPTPAGEQRLARRHRRQHPRTSPPPTWKEPTAPSHSAATPATERRTSSRSSSDCSAPPRAAPSPSRSSIDQRPQDRRLPGAKAPHPGLARVVLVGDRGMLTSARIREDLAGVEGLRITARPHHQETPRRRDRERPTGSLTSARRAPHRLPQPPPRRRAPP